MCFVYTVPMNEKISAVQKIGNWVSALLLGNTREIIDRLKPGAFKTGADIEMVLFVGGVYLRDLIFADLGFTLS